MAGGNDCAVAFSIDYVLWAQGVLVSEAYTVAPGGIVNVTASLSTPGEDALFALLARAFAAAPPAQLLPSAALAQAASLSALARGDATAFSRLHGRAGAPGPFVGFGVAFSSFAFDA